MRRGLCTLYDQSPSALCLGNPVARDLHVVIGRVDARRPIMSVLTQSYQCCMWFVCSILRELAVSNLGQLLFCLSITWSRCRNAYRDLWIMTITSSFSTEHMASIDWAKTTARREEKHLSFEIRCVLCWRFHGSWQNKACNCRATYGLHPCQSP